MGGGIKAIKTPLHDAIVFANCHMYKYSYVFTHTYM